MWSRRQPDFDELEKMDLSRVKIMWTNYPNMPTGANATMELYEKLVDFALVPDIHAFQECCRWWKNPSRAHL